ncbi:ROK family protein [Neobacillus kokaensis]|uniref:Glucokinase n=1 Tax=Neobacillus kokaensis TaxID=2759023 RepID=A0ABQ3NB48_9BACI|nr:ROK family protein [Neobacillus kokaensis]GHI01122.1 glucokinase [Neobacillus kokaensis]
MAEYLSIDIGGTYIKYALIDDRKQLYGHHKVETKGNIDDAILKQVETIIAGVMEHTVISGIGISTAGIVDREKGEIIYAGPTIKNYIGTQFKSYLSRKFGLPVHVENDVNAALIGEVWQGAAKDEDQVFCITLGTGIGGAYYHQQIIDGYYHQAHSVGYLLYDPETKTNYEMRASTSALNQRIHQELGAEVSTADVFDRAKQGDDTCLSLIEAWSQEVAKGLAQIILLIDPKCILIGGGISRQGSYLLDHIQKQLPAFLPDHFLKTNIKIAELYNDAALFGAVYPFFKEEKSSC